MIDSTLDDVRVRPARSDDRHRMLELWERSIRATHLFLEEEDVELLRPLVAEELASAVADRCGRPALPHRAHATFVVIPDRTGWT